MYIANAYIKTYTLYIALAVLGIKIIFNILFSYSNLVKDFRVFLYRHKLDTIIINLSR